MPTVNKRSYRSGRRQQQAEATRERIVDCARELFLSAGFGATTIGKIAESAGVAPPTVYAVFGSKQGLLVALLDDMGRRADRLAFEQAMQAAAGDPQRQLAEAIAFNIRFFEQNIELISLMRTVSGVEHDVQEVWKEGEARRRRAEEKLVADWERAGALAPTVTASQAVDLFWAMSGPDFYRLMVVESKWDRTTFRDWLTTTLARMLLKP